MNAEMFEKICQEIESTPKGVFRICREFEVSSTDFYKLVNASQENALRYARSKDIQCDIKAEHIEDIADEMPPMTERGYDAAAVNHARLRVDTRKWLLAKLKPKKYGDMVQQRIGDSDGKPMQVFFNIPRPGDNIERND